MSEIWMTATVFTMLIVLSREQILDEIPIGTPETAAVEYFHQITGQENIHYYTAETSGLGTVSYSLKDNEKGYYMVGIDNIREHWWWPSFGRHLVVIAVISESGVISKIEFFGSRSGWP